MTLISFAKEERIDKQYYVTSELVLTKESTQDMFEKAEDFLVKIKLLIRNLGIEEISIIRKKFESLF